MINISRYLVTFFWFMASWLCQKTLIFRFAILDAKPNLMLFFPVFAGLLEGPLAGLVLGAIVGLFEDLLIGKLIGINVLALAAAGFCVGFLNKKFYKDNYFVPIAAMALGVIVYSLVYLGVVFFIEASAFNVMAYAKQALGTMIYNSVLALLFYFPVYRSWEKGWLKKKSRS